MTNPSPDWLDDVLRQRPVDDEGFSARVSGLGHSEARTWWIVRIVLAVVVTSGLAACTSFELFILGALFDNDQAVDGRVWVDEHRADWGRVVGAKDAHPALRRRAGRDASPVLNEAIRRSQFPNARTEDLIACAKDAGELRGNQEVPPGGVCDTSWIVGLAAYDEWKTPPLDESFSERLVTVARAHLRRAAAAPLVPGAPAPFAVAARDVEALGRLTMTCNGRGARFFGVVASEHERAAAEGRAGDHDLVVDENGADLLRRAWFAGIAFAAPAATDDDVAAVGRLQSVLACGALSDAFGRADLGAYFLDDHRVERVRALDRTGCTPPRHQPLEEHVCADMTPGFCRLLLAPTSLPPFRQRVVRALERWSWGRLSLDKTPLKNPSAATTEQR